MKRKPLLTPRYPSIPQLARGPGVFDGYVAATGATNSISANAWEIHERDSPQPLAPADGRASSHISTQERGILRAIISLIEMCPKGSKLKVYTSLENAANGWSGQHSLFANSDLLNIGKRLAQDKQVEICVEHCPKWDEKRRIIITRLGELAKELRDSKLRELGGQLGG